MGHGTTVMMIRGGIIREMYERQELTAKMISDVKLACYTYLQGHRDELDATRQRLREWLPEIFHEEIDEQMKMISQAEENKQKAIAGIH